MVYATPLMDARKELATIIKRCRLESGLKQEAFALEVGIVAAHLSRLEHAQGLPSIELIGKISDRFGADRAQLMSLLRRIKGYEDSPPRPLLKRSSRGVPVPVIQPDELCDWLKSPEIVAAGDLLHHEPVTREMTHDKAAFWLVARGSDMCGGLIAELDLLLVEPGEEPRRGHPALVILDGRVMVRIVRKSRDTIVLDPACKGQDEFDPIPRKVFEERNGCMYRLAGYRPTFRPFAVERSKKSA